MLVVLVLINRLINDFRTFELAEMCQANGHYLTLCLDCSGQDVATILHLVHNLIHEEEDEEKDQTSQW